MERFRVTNTDSVLNSNVVEDGTGIEILKDTHQQRITNYVLIQAAVEIMQPEMYEWRK
jgi:response regulator of citrate/malate metabolism